MSPEENPIATQLLSGLTVRERISPAEVVDVLNSCANSADRKSRYLSMDSLVAVTIMVLGAGRVVMAVIGCEDPLESSILTTSLVKGSHI